MQNHNSVWADKWVLTHTRQMGPQSVIVGVEGVYGGTFLAKIYANKALYQNELRLYQMPRMKGFFPDVVDMAGTAGSSTSVQCIEVPASGGAHTLPPHKIMLKGRSLKDQSTAQRHTLLEVMRVLGQVSLTLEMLHAAGAPLLAPVPKYGLRCCSDSASSGGCVYPPLLGPLPC